MKIGINAWSFPANMTLPQGLKTAKGAGFDAVELNVGEEGYLTPETDEIDAGKLRTAVENMSLELSSLVVGMLFEYPLTSGDPEIASKGKEAVRKSLQLASWMGADTVLVIPGTVTSDVSYDAAWERSLAALRELAEEAEKQQVNIALENVWNKFLLSPLEFRSFIDAIASPWVGAYFDVGNVLVNGYPEQWIRILGSRIKKVHVKDFRSSIGSVQGFANILEGDVDWYAVKNALKEIGYDDVVTAEIEGYRTLPDLGIRHAGESLKRIFKGSA